MVVVPSHNTYPGGISTSGESRPVACRAWPKSDASAGRSVTSPAICWATARNSLFDRSGQRTHPTLNAGRVAVPGGAAIQPLSKRGKQSRPSAHGVGYQVHIGSTSFLKCTLPSNILHGRLTLKRRGMAYTQSFTWDAEHRRH
jgi:hypothetical protein